MDDSGKIPPFSVVMTRLHAAVAASASFRVGCEDRRDTLADTSRDPQVRGSADSAVVLPGGVSELS
jgi:hypothetical protein